MEHSAPFVGSCECAAGSRCGAFAGSRSWSHRDGRRRSVSVAGEIRASIAVREGRVVTMQGGPMRTLSGCLFVLTLVVLLVLLVGDRPAHAQQRTFTFVN